MDIVLFIISVVGFGLSIYNFILPLIDSREKYQLDVIDYAVREPISTQFFVCFSNTSIRPLAIVSISYNGITCELEPKAIKNLPSDWNFRSSPQFPICIPARSSQYAYLEFVDRHHSHIPLSSGTAVTFEIHSTRKLAQKTLTLGDKAHYLHRRE